VLERLLDLAKNLLLPLEPKLLAMWKKMGKALKIVYSANQFCKNMVLFAPTGLALYR
jgi:hypothetical protein